MPLQEKNLLVKKSGLPNAGKGLFTKKLIPAGTRIVEYKGKITTWKDVEHDEGKNGYIYYVKRNHVIDAGNRKSALARYANDAKGIARVKGISNNAEYIEDGIRVYIKAVKDIQAGSEILVEYGKEYWDAIRHNIKIDKKNKRS
jgi:uncharacterized protein